MAMGWRGSARHWSVYETASLLLAGLATPLVLSVHTVVSFDFTIAIVPGWHSTFFPPYFVAGAIYSGFAMVLALAIPLRSVYGLQGLITDKHLDNCGKVMLATGLIVAYAYHHGNLHRLVQRQRLRRRRHLESHDRPVCLLVLVAADLQHRGAAVPLDQEGAQHAGAAVHLGRSWCWSACGWSAT